MQFSNLAILLAACSTLTSAFDPRAAAALAQHEPHTRCSTFLSTITTTRTRGEVETGTSTVLVLQPTVTTVYNTITSITTYTTTEEHERTQTRTQTVSECVVGQPKMA